LSVVPKYKHLGSIVPIDGNDMHDSKLRSASALSAYCPLASKVFGSAKVGFWLKLVFLHSLVMSRLLYQVCLWNGKPKPFRNLNAVYMRALRRIAGESRFSDKNNCTDLQVRAKLLQPSLDCLIARRRLLHLACIEKSRTMVLHALLAPIARKARLPWVELVLGDLSRLFMHPVSHGILRTIHKSMPDSNSWPLTEPSSCSCPGCCQCASRWKYIVLHTKWSEAVGSFSSPTPCMTA
jgi:hypothetical protein